MIPSLHGSCLHPLSFIYIQDDQGTWTQDFSRFVPVTYPEPAPDYSPADLERIRLAEEKRLRKMKKRDLT